MGLLVDFVNTVEEAEEFCRDSLPHAIVYECVLDNERFQKLRGSIVADMPIGGGSSASVALTHRFAAVSAFAQVPNCLSVKFFW